MRNLTAVIALVAMLNTPAISAPPMPGGETTGPPVGAQPGGDTALPPQVLVMFLLQHTTTLDDGQTYQLIDWLALASDFVGTLPATAAPGGDDAGPPVDHQKTTWKSGGLEHSIVTYKRKGESDYNWLKRHAERVEKAVGIWSPDQDEGDTALVLLPRLPEAELAA